ncbi:MAG: dienelactone hydrolase family protein [Gemmataceae bacterium]|nr:dienelactone hydrolase family protein [Gemmataceae bacterium]
MQSALVILSLVLGQTTDEPPLRKEPPAKAITEKASPWDVTRTIEVGGQKRSYHFHLPTGYTPKKAFPLVVALHGAGMTARVMEWFSGLTPKADEAGFIVVYPNGTGTFQTWNAGAFPGRFNRSDDIGFLDKLLDDVESIANVDTKRIYVTGMSNGGMMSYRVGAELSHRVAAIAPVAGTLALAKWEPKHPMPVLHFHGTEDNLVPYKGSPKFSPDFVTFRSIEDTIRICVKANGSDETPKVSELPTPKDKLKVTRKEYPAGPAGAEVILYVVEGGGHIWPGRPIPGLFLGPTTYNIAANDVIWDFFKQHSRK